MGFDIEEWTVRVLEHGLPALPDRLEPGETVAAAVCRGERHGAVLFLRMWKNGQPDSDCALTRRGEDGSWEPPSGWGGGSWIENPMVRPETGWDGHPVEWLSERTELAQGEVDGVRAFTGAASKQVAAIRVEQGGQVWSVPIESPCGAFVVVAESLAPATLAAVDDRGDVLQGPDGSQAMRRAA